MTRKTPIWQLCGFAVTSLCGTLLHFLYELLDKPVWIAPFSGVNESTFEHMKLLFWPMLLFALIQSFFFRDREDYWCVKLKGIILGLSLIPLIFYIYNGVIGSSPDWINILIFFISAAAAYLYELVAFDKAPSRNCNQRLSIAVIVLIALSFIIFTFFTPKLGIFMDPLTGAYGI